MHDPEESRDRQSVENQQDQQEIPEEFGPSHGPIPPGQLYRVGWVFYLLLAVVGVVWIGIRDGGIGLALLVDPELPAAGMLRSLAMEIGLGIATALLIVGGWELAERRSAAAAAVSKELRTMLSGLSASEAVSLALLSGVSEEIFFRGALQGSFNTWQGWLGATFLFAILHSGPGQHFRWWTLFAAIAGGLLGLWFLLLGTLTAPITAHVAVNGFQLLRASLRDTA